MITPKILDAHMAKRHPNVVRPEIPPMESKAEEQLAADTLPQPLTPENTPPPPPYVSPVPEKIKLSFRRPIEIRINSIPYNGLTVEAPNMEIASEIVRIAREAYGSDILI